MTTLTGPHRAGQPASRAGQPTPPAGPDDVHGSLGVMLGGRLGRSPVMIGRATPLGRLRRLTSSPAAELAFVSGEAGIGKTRLLREVVLGSGRTVLAGQADPTALNRPFALIGDMLGPAGWVDVNAALGDLVARIGDAGAIVVFEDLHWADTASVEVFERLAQQRRPGVLLIGSYRPDELSRRLPGGDMLLRLERRHDIDRIHLDRLTRSEVAAFLATVYDRPLPSSIADAMFERTGGNPFFLEEMLDCCGDVSPDELADQPLPWSLEEVVRRQLDGLSAPERRLAETAAILGPSASFDVLGGVADLGEDELVVRLRSLVDSGLLVEHDDHFAFRHALVRDAVEGHLLGRERRRLHERALRLLDKAGGAPAAELARHAAGAGYYDEMVDHARVGVVHELRQHGSSHLALRLAVDALAEARDDIVLLEVATEAAWLLGLNDEALGYAERLRAVSSGRLVSLGSLATATRWIVRLQADRSDRAGLVAALASLVSLLDEPLEPIDRARTEAAVAQSYMLQHERELAVAWADRAVATAVALGAADGAASGTAAAVADSVRVQALIERGSARASLDPAAGAELLAAIDEAEALGEWVLVTRGINNLFDVVPVHTPDGRRLLERFRHAADRAGFDAMSTAVSLLRSADLAMADGDMAEADDCLAQAMTWMPLHRAKEGDWVESHALALALERGEVEGLAARIERLDAAKRRDQPGAGTMCPPRWWNLHLELQLAALRNDRATAEERLRSVASDPHAEPLDGPSLLDAVDAAARVGAPPDLVRAVLLAPGSLRRPAGARALLAAEAVVLQAERRHAEATAAFAVALDDPDPAFGAPLLGYLGALAATSELALGRRERARELVAVATPRLARWPGWRRDRLAELATRLDAPAAAPPGELTVREHEVAALVAEGLSNGALARRLFISPKTASVHVSNILMKLQLANRAEIAAWVVRHAS